jgi:hypothetical protein
MQHDDDVVAGRRQLTPTLYGDRDVVDDRAVLQRQRADIHHGGLTLGGQAHFGWMFFAQALIGGYLGDRHVIHT